VAEPSDKRLRRLRALRRKALRVLERAKKRRAKRVIARNRKKANALLRAIRHRRRVLAFREKNGRTHGVEWFDGRKVAAWMVPYLTWARKHGWKGHVVSGWRDPAYSERLCWAMCGAPRCPGRCAGRSSNHSGSVKPHGAIDVSDYQTFGRLMHSCPLRPHIYNALGARDPVHYSVSGS
jgi:hypothetical protein